MSSNPSSSPSWDAFLSHYQATGGGVVLALREAVLAACAARSRPPLRLWCDIDVDASWAGMQSGVLSSSFFVLVATDGVLARPAVQHEVKCALVARKPIVVVIVAAAAAAGASSSSGAALDAGAALESAVERGQAFSADPRGRADGLVHLEAEDFAELVRRASGKPAVVFHEDEQRLARETVPAFIAQVVDAEGAHPSPSPSPSTSPARDPPFRMRGPAPSSPDRMDVLVVAAPLARQQSLFLHAALSGAHQCARRGLRVAVLDPAADAETAKAAVGRASAVVCVLTSDVWESAGVRGALDAVVAASSSSSSSSSSLSSRGPRLSFVHEADTRFGGVLFDELLKRTPSQLCVLFAQHIASPLERQREKRAAFLAWLFSRVGAVRADLVGGSLPPPSLPPQFDEQPVRETLGRLEGALLVAAGKSGPRAVATGGLGGAGKTTLAAALVHRPSVQRAFDEIFWVTLGHVGREAVLDRMRAVIAELEACGEGAGTAGGAPSEPAKSLEAAGARLRALLASSRCLLVVDDAWELEHFSAWLGALPRGEDADDAAATGAASTSSAARRGSSSSSSSSRILFTTRSPGLFAEAAAACRLGAAEAAVVPMGPLPPDAASAFVARAAGIPAERAGRLPLDGLWGADETRRLPLTLTVVSASLRKRLEGLGEGEEAEAEGAAVEEVVRGLAAAGVPAPAAAAAPVGGAASLPAAISASWLEDPAFLAALAARSPAGWEAYLPVHRAIQLALTTHFAASDIRSFAALGLFPEDAYVPEEVVAVAWRMGRAPARALLERMSAAGLVKLEAAADAARASGVGGAGGSGGGGSGGGAHVMLHDLAHDFAGALCASSGAGSAAMHSRLVERLYAAAVGGEVKGGGQREWWRAADTPAATPLPAGATRLPAVSRYVMEQLPYHLDEAGLHEESRRLFTTLEWLAGVVAASGVRTLLAQGSAHILPRARAAAGEEEEEEEEEGRAYTLLHQALELSQLALADVEERRGDALVAAAGVLVGQLIGRLAGPLAAGAYPATLGRLVGACEAWRAPAGAAWLVPRGPGGAPALDAPGGPLLRVLEGHADAITCLAALADGRVVSGSRDGAVRVWDSSSGDCERALVQQYEVTCLAVLPDGRRVVFSAGDRSVLFVWDASSGVLERTLEGHTGRVACLLALPDGRVVSGSTDKTVRVWDVLRSVCERVLKGHRLSIKCLAALPGGGRVASGSRDGNMRVWDVSSTVCEHVLEGHTGGVTCLVALADGRRVVSGSRDGIVRVWNASMGVLERTLEGHTGRVTCLLALPDGRVVSGSGDSTVRVWNGVSSDAFCERVLEGHTGGVTCLFSLADGRILSGSTDESVRWWNPVSSDACEHVLDGHPGDLNVLLSLSDGRVVSGALDGTVRVWDAAASGGVCERTLEGHPGEITSLLALADGRTVSGALDGTVCVWNASSGVCERTMRGHVDEITCLLSLPGGRVMSGSRDRAMCVWDVSSGVRERVLEGHEDELTCLAALPDGRVVSGSKDRTVRVWDVQSGVCEPVLRGHTIPITCMVAFPDGRVVSGSGDETLHVWDASRRLREHVLRGHTGGVLCLAALPGGGRVASGSRDGIVRVWNASKGVLERVLSGHTGEVDCLVALPGGGRLVSGSKDRTVRVWDVSSTVCERVLEGHTGGVTCLVALPDGRRVVSGSWTKTVCVWDVSTGVRAALRVEFPVMTMSLAVRGRVVVGGRRHVVAVDVRG
jgi:WD40 repeat protein